MSARSSAHRQAHARAITTIVLCGKVLPGGAGRLYLSVRREQCVRTRRVPQGVSNAPHAACRRRPYRHDRRDRAGAGEARRERHRQQGRFHGQHRAAGLAGRRRSARDLEGGLAHAGLARRPSACRRRLQRCREVPELQGSYQPRQQEARAAERGRPRQWRHPERIRGRRWVGQRGAVHAFRQADRAPMDCRMQTVLRS